MALEQKLKQLQVKINQNPLTSATIFIAVLLLLLIVIPYLQVGLYGINNDTVNATLENQYRATFAQVLGGVAIAIGLYYTWRRISIAEEDLKATQKNLEVIQEGQITERFTRAVDQLGNPAMEIRLGGIYALERIANESDKDYWPIMEILTAYVRKNSSFDYLVNGNIPTIEPISMDIQANEFTKKEASEVTQLSLDNQAVLTVLGRRKYVYNKEIERLNLSKTFLNHLTLSEAHFEGTDFKYSYLQRTFFEKIHFEHAKFTSAHLEVAELRECNLEGACFENGRFEGAYITKSNLKKIFSRDANFEEVNFFMSNLEEAYLSGANLKKALLFRANFERATLDRANLSGANLSGANLSGANLSGANLSGARNLTIDQLSKVKTLYKAELDPVLKEELRAKGYSHLLDDEPKY